MLHVYMLHGLGMVIAEAWPAIPKTPQGWVIFVWICLLFLFMKDPSKKITFKLIKLINKVNAQKKRIKVLKHKLGD